MSEPLLDALGKLMIEQIRDSAISEGDSMVCGRMKDAHSQQIYKRLQALNSEQLEGVRYLILHLVDTVLHDVLWMFERADSIHISMDTDNGTISDIRDNALGELQGYLYDWIPRFSSQPYDPPA